MIKTIIFDLSEVLLHGLLGIEQYLFETYGLKVENTQWKIEAMDRFFHGEITENDYWQAAIDQYNWDITIDQLKEAVRKNFREIEGTRTVIEALKKNGYTLGLLSVHAKEWIEHCEEKYGYHKLFDSIMYSYEVAVSKPDTKAFQLILEKMNVSPEETLFIDDSITNIASAAALGMHTIRFINASDLAAELAKRGLISVNVNH